MERILGLPTWVWLVVGVVVYITYFKKEGFTNSDNIKIYNFNTEWCGWSKRFQPEWDEFTRRVNADRKLNVEALDIKCDDSKNESMCEKFEVPGFPSVVAEVNGKRQHYKGPRTADALMEFVRNLK